MGGEGTHGGGCGIGDGAEYGVEGEAGNIGSDCGEEYKVEEDGVVEGVVDKVVVVVPSRSLVALVAAAAVGNIDRNLAVFVVAVVVMVYVVEEDSPVVVVDIDQNFLDTLELVAR